MRVSPQVTERQVEIVVVFTDKATVFVLVSGSKGFTKRINHKKTHLSLNHYYVVC